MNVILAVDVVHMLTVLTLLVVVKSHTQDCFHFVCHSLLILPMILSYIALPLNESLVLMMTKKMMT